MIFKKIFTDKDKTSGIISFCNFFAYVIEGFEIKVNEWLINTLKQIKGI